MTVKDIHPRESTFGDCRIELNEITVTENKYKNNLNVRVRVPYSTYEQILVIVFPHHTFFVYQEQPL